MTGKFKNSKSISGFSLLELSIVLLIISILVSGGITVSKSTINNAKNKVTKDRLDVIYKALGSFVAANKRLPCPAPLSYSKANSLYGTEATSSNTGAVATICDTPSSLIYTSTNATNLAYGAVPIKALNLPNEMAEDGFGNKFEYIVDKRFAFKTDDTTPVGGFEEQQGVPNVGDSPTALNIIQIKTSTYTITDLALFVILSHGSNGFKAWPSSGTTQNTTASTVTDENDNSRDESTNNFNNGFVVTSTDPNFDDAVFYKTKQQLTLDSGMEFIRCSRYEGNIQFPVASGYGSCTTGTTTTSATTNYGATGTVTCPGASPCSGSLTRTCGKYGVWGSLSGNCI